MPRNKSSPEQLSYLVEYIKSQTEIPELSGNYDRSLQGRAKMDKLWSDLATTLNKMEGPIKTPKQWKQTWRDLKSNVKKKLNRNLNAIKCESVSGTRNDSAKIYDITEMDEAVMSVVEPIASCSMANSSEQTEKNTPNTGSRHNPSRLLIGTSNSSHTKQDIENSTAFGKHDTLLLFKCSQKPSEASLKDLLNSSQAPKKMKRSSKYEDYFEKMKLEFKKEKLSLKREKNNILKERNIILQAQNVAIIRIGNMLDEILEKKFRD